MSLSNSTLNNAGNLTGANKPKVSDQLLEKARKEPNSDKPKKFYREARKEREDLRVFLSGLSVLRDSKILA